MADPAAPALPDPPAPTTLPAGPPTPPRPVPPGQPQPGPVAAQLAMSRSAWTGPAAAAPRGATLPPRPPGRLSTALTEFWAGRHHPTSPVVMAASAAVGVAGGVLVVGHRLGLGAAVVGLAMWLPAVPAMVRRRAVVDLVSAVLSVALLAVVAVRDAEWLVALCVLGAAGLGAVAATSARSAPAVLLAVVGWFAGAFRALPWLGTGVSGLAGARWSQVLVALRSIAVTVVLLIVFGVLFVSADDVFASYVPQVDLDILPGQVVVGLLVALATATTALLAMAPPGWSRIGLAPGRPARRGEWLLPVLALDALVVAFVLVQLGALIGGHAYVLATTGLTYAEYARQGFAQLVAVTVLTLLVVGVAARRVPRSGPRDLLVSRVALGVLCVATLGVVASALRRMTLYMDAFGLTRLRLVVLVAEVVLAVILLLVMVAGVRWRGAWLPVAVVQVVALGLLGLVAVDPDALIVRHNVEARLEVPLDTQYLEGLSADAVPALATLDEPLRSCLLERAAGDIGPSSGLGEWNLGRARARTTFVEAGVVAADPDPYGYVEPCPVAGSAG